jgi:hypothetical protein
MKGAVAHHQLQSFSQPLGLLLVLLAYLFEELLAQCVAGLAGVLDVLFVDRDGVELALKHREHIVAGRI